jgi:hypothetical protein
MAPASCSTEIAQPCSVRIAARLSFIISIEIAPATETNPFGTSAVPAVNTWQGFGIAGAQAFPRVPVLVHRSRLADCLALRSSRLQPAGSESPLSAANCPAESTEGTSDETGNGQWAAASAPQRRPRAHSEVRFLPPQPSSRGLVSRSLGMAKKAANSGLSRVRRPSPPSPFRYFGPPDHAESPASSANIPVFRRPLPETWFDRNCRPTAAVRFRPLIRFLRASQSSLLNRRAGWLLCKQSRDRLGLLKGQSN